MCKYHCMKRYSLLFVFSLLIPVFTWAQADTAIRERVYLQTDKSLYLAGELVWMKLILTDDLGQPFAGSKVGYVELLDKETAQVQAKLELTGGVGEGWMMVPLTLPTGNYRLVAYTRYMRNEGENIFFEKILPVVNTFTVDKSIRQSTDTLATVFEERPDRGISLRTDKQAYTFRTAGELQIVGLPNDLHTLSISIAGREPIPGITSSGIEQWENRLAFLPKNDFSVTITPEYEGHILTGKLANVVNGGKVNPEGLMPLLGFTGNQIRMFGGQLNPQGEVTFYTSRISGTHEVVTAVLDPGASAAAVDVQYGDTDQPADQPAVKVVASKAKSNNSQYRLDIQSPFMMHKERALPELRLHPVWNESLLQRSVSLQVLHNFMADSMSKAVAGDAFFQWQPTNVYKLDEYTRFTTMEEVVIEFIPSLRFRRFSGRRHLSVLTEDRMGFTIGNSLVLLDGIPVINHENIFKYDPLKVERIEIYRGKYIFGGQMVNGIVSFKTYDHNYPGLTMDASTQIFDYEGTGVHRLFYAPSYQTDTERKSRVPDYRHTLLWDPNVPTEGKTTIDIPFSTSDLPGEYVITVEGLTRGGQPVSATKLITVK